jgi:hypothetical protein
VSGDGQLDGIQPRPSESGYAGAGCGASWASGSREYLTISHVVPSFAACRAPVDHGAQAFRYTV